MNYLLKKMDCYMNLRNERLANWEVNTQLCMRQI